MKLGELLNMYNNLLETQDALMEQVNEVKHSIQEVEKQILDEMEGIGVDRAEANGFVVTKKAELMPQVKDKKTFVNWCVENGMVEDFIQSRCNIEPFRHYATEYGEYPPGTEGYVKTKLNYRR